MKEREIIKEIERERRFFNFTVIIMTLTVIALTCVHVITCNAHEDLLTQVCQKEYGQKYELSENVKRTFWLEVPKNIRCAKKTETINKEIIEKEELT